MASCSAREGVPLPTHVGAPRALPGSSRAIYSASTHAPAPAPTAALDTSRATDYPVHRWGAAHLVVLMIVRVLLRPLPQGPALTSSVWAVYAVALVAAGLRLRNDVVRQIGLGTVLATVAKVLLLDLSDFPTLWRVLLFMGLGALLLTVSYFVPTLLRGAGKAAGADDGPRATDDEAAARPTAHGGGPSPAGGASSQTGV